MKTESDFLEEYGCVQSYEGIERVFEEENCISAMIDLKKSILIEIKNIIQKIQSEPNGIVRETMIDNLLIDL